MNKSYKYINSVEGNTVVPVPAVTFPDIIYVDREGVGIRIQNYFDTGDSIGEAFAFTRMSKKQITGGFTPAYILQSSLIISGGVYNRKYIIGGGGYDIEGLAYSFVIKGVDARYTVEAGDTLADIYAGIEYAINASTYPAGYTITASSTSSSVTISLNTGTIVDHYVVYSDIYKFESGYFAQIEVLGVLNDYLIELNSDNTNYPPLGTLSSSYDFDLLTHMTNGYNDWLISSTSPYYIKTLRLYTASQGDLTVSDVPYIVENSSRAVLDPNASRLIFSHKTKLKKNEIIKMIYK